VLVAGGVRALASSWLLTADADTPQASATVLITVMQLSIALGSALGGVPINAHGVATVFVVGGGFALLAGLLAAGLGRRRTPKAG
jgi:predicted MFS family arabinose efflux permease